MIYDRLKFRAGESFGAVLDRYRGIGPGYDILRILLALSIFLLHAKWLSGTAGMDMTHVTDMGHGLATATTQVRPVAFYQGPLRPIKLAVVPMFFALSGFLVMGSAIRLRATSTFLAHRGLRIFPALMVEVSLSAILLGPALTSLPLRDYFGDPQFWRYFGNIVGAIVYHLPGVFEGNPRAGLVNMSLWTLTGEFYCYLLMAAAMLTRLAYSRTGFTIAMAAITLYLAVENHITGMSIPYRGPYNTHVIVYYFLFGALFFHWKHIIPARLGFFVASIPLSYLLLKYDELIYVAPIALVYGTLFFGLLPLPKFAALSSGDYSYGLYLYGFPVTQSVLALWPGLFVKRPLLLMPVAFLATVVIAVLSWRGIERHALGLKRHLPHRWFPTNRRNRVFEEQRLASEAA